MAVTRIKNNQITDATVVANAKLVDYSISSAKLANNLTYESNLTITGNLLVQGNSTAIDTTITTIEDPVIVLASTQTSGAPAVDIGFLGFRGNESNIAFVWDESADEFVTAFTSTGETNTTITITSYANFHTNNANIGGNLTLIGNANITGNVANLNVTGNVTSGNLLTPGIISAAATVTGGNVLTGGIISAGSNITGGNLLTGGLISATSTITSAANITGGNILTGGVISAGSNITGGNLLFGSGIVSGTGNVFAANFIGNISGNLSAPGANTEVIFNDSNVANATAGFTFNKTSNVLSVNGNILSGGNISAVGNVFAVGIRNGNTGLQIDPGSPGFIQFSNGNGSTVLIGDGGNISAAGNVTGANILTAGLISAGGDLFANNVNTDNVISSGALSITTGANANINIQPNGTGNIVLSNTYINGLQLTPQQDADAASKFYVDQLVTTAISYHEAVVVATTTDLATATGGTITYAQPNGAANGIGATLTTTGSFNLIDSANVQSANTRILVKNEANAAHNGIYAWSNATVITRAADEDTYGPASANTFSINDYFFVSSGNVNLGSAWIVDAPSGTITFGTSNIQFAQFSQSQVYAANTSAGLSLIGQTFNAKIDNNTTAFDLNGNISVKASANLTTPNIGAATGTSLSASGNVTGGNLLTGGLISATSTITSAANITGGNVLTGGLISATSTITSAANITGGNLLTSGAGGAISGSGNITGGNLLTGGIISAGSNITGGNLLTGGVVSTSSNITGGNLLFGSGIVSGTGNIYANNIFANISGNIDAAGSNTQIQFNDGDLLGGSAGFTFDKTSNAVVANGNITASNFNTAGLITATGNVVAGNLILVGAALDTTAGRLTVNSTSADADFAVNGDTLANVFYVDAGTGTVSFGSSTQVTNVIANFNTTTSIKAPVGNTAQRPATGVTGMLRFNTTNNNLELYDNTQWTAVGVPVFTVIADEQFNGDGSTVAFTLATSQTTNSCIVSINGVVQIPTLAYSVSTTTLTFTEAPLSGDVIDVRELTTTTTVTSIANSSGNAVVATSETAANVNVTGNLVISGSVSAAGFIGLDATKIANGTSEMAVVSSGGNIRSNIAGTTVMTISPGLVDIQGNLTVSGNATLSGNILGDRIQNGTTSLDIQTASGNANINIGGTGNLAVFAPGNLLMTGNITPTANITYDLGTNTNRWKDIWLANSTIYLGNSQISANATSLIFTNPAGGQTVLAGATAGITGATVSASGNITGANVIATANIAIGTGAGNLQIGTSTSNSIHFTNPASAGNITFLANVGGTITEVFKGLGAGGFSVIGNISTGNTITAGGNVSGANVIATTDIYTPEIVKTGSNAVGNIGQSSNYFNTVFAQATSALYADLAEKYVADAEYPAGTVVAFGGSHEVTIASNDSDRRVAGVISTNPSYIMNAGLEATHLATVALTGRVPCQVTGIVRKGDLMVSAGNGHARAEENPAVGTVIGKALEDFDGTQGVIEVVVGRF